MNDIVVLWETNVGSHMWNMETPKSDIDVYRGYTIPTKDILMGIARQNSHQSVDGMVDRASHEIGIIINQLIKGNINHVWGVMSPLIMECNEHWLKELREIVLRNQSKNIYHSTMGMAFHNHKKYVLNRLMEDPMREKKCNVVVRSINFGIAVLEGRGFRFDKVIGCEIGDIAIKMDELERAYHNSILPEDTPNPNEFREFLFNLRMHYLEE